MSSARELMECLDENMLEEPMFRSDPVTKPTVKFTAPSAFKSFAGAGRKGIPAIAASGARQTMSAHRTPLTKLSKPTHGPSGSRLAVRPVLSNTRPIGTKAASARQSTIAITPAVIDIDLSLDLPDIALADEVIELNLDFAEELDVS